MKEYYCNGKKGICDAAPDDCDGCLHWDGSGGEEIDTVGNLRWNWLTLLKYRLKYLFKRKR